MIFGDKLWNWLMTRQATPAIHRDGPRDVAAVVLRGGLGADQMTAGKMDLSGATVRPAGASVSPVKR